LGRHHEVGPKIWFLNQILGKGNKRETKGKGLPKKLVFLVEIIYLYKN
jgi:hypothetical protein